MAIFTREQLKPPLGPWRSETLYAELNRRNPSDVIMTLHDEPRVWKGRTLPSLKQFYFDYEDVTEYAVAMAVFGSWDGWMAQVTAVRVAPYIQKYREELAIKQRSEVLRAMAEVARTEGSKGVTAQKYLAQRGWETRAGRPTKAQLESTKKVEAGIQQNIAEDLERIGLKH